MEPVVNFCYLSEPQRLHAPSPSLPFERGNLSSGDVEFVFFCATAASSTKTVTEMPTVTSLSKRMKERFVFNCLHTTLSLFSVSCLVRLCLHSYHDSPPRCRPRGLHVPRAPCAGRPGEIWGTGSRREKWFRLGEIGGMATKASSRDWSSW